MYKRWHNKTLSHRDNDHYYNNSDYKNDNDKIC